jgi:hypothetical protein
MDDKENLVLILWNSYFDFVKNNKVPSVDYPDDDWLPITPTKNIHGPELKKYLESLIEEVIKPICEKVCDKYFEICIWDPFREEDSKNWALTGKGTNKLKEQMDIYLEGINREEINIFYYIYCKLKKEIIMIKVTPNIDEDPSCEPSIDELTQNRNLDEDEKAKFKKAIELHENFRNERDIYIYYVPTIFYPEKEKGIGGLIYITDYELQVLCRHFRYVIESALSGIGVNYLFNNFYKQSIKSATASIMSRNMSHNIGSHVLSSIPLEEIEIRKYDISKFNSYLQQRMDFLARISTEWPVTGEYLCFYSDLMRNFLKQSLLLEKIIKDDGVDGKKIKIHLKVNDSAPIKFSRQPESHHKEKEAKCGDNCKVKNECGCGECEYDYRIEGKEKMNAKDLLIQLPSGMLGTQAFYVILENIMRNSAKYNKKSCEYEIYIEIGENRDLETKKDNDLSYKVRIYDNFSENKDGYPLEENGKTGNLVQLLQEKLEKPLIKETGEIIEKDWGIQEIKIAAQFLNHPFKEKKIGISTKENDHTKKYVWVEPCTREVTVKVGNDCKKAEKELASYVFSIPKAKLVLCVDHHKKEKIKKAEGKGVLAADFKNEKFIEKMKKSSPEILYFEINEGDPDKDTNRFKEVLEKIEKYKYFLPTRIVIALNKNSLDSLKKKQKLETLAKDYDIPPRRFVVCPLDKEMIAEINGDDSIEKFIISVYKQWVFRWHGKELMGKEKFKDVGIVIYFDRDKGFTGFQKWKKLREELNKDEYKLNNIKFSLFYKVSKNEKKSLKFSDFNAINWKSKGIELLIGLDNHGTLRGGFENTMREKKKWDFYQVIGHDSSWLKMNNHSMFNLLQDVPPGFAGVMFVLSLIESAFARVGVVDERVANWAFEEEGGEFNFKFSITTQNILGANLFISASVWDGDKRHQLVGKEKKPEDFRLMSEEKDQEEGISEDWCRFFSMKNGLTSNFHNREIDILIIHLGFLEEIFKKDKERIEKWLDNLHERIPKIVMISGRGYKPEEIPGGLPFREASLVTNYINSDFSKLNLVKGLISPRGKY